MEIESQTVALELMAFGAADIERLTGVTRDMQRDWRRRGIAPARRSHVGDLIAFDLTRQIGRTMGNLLAAASVAALFAPAVLHRVARDRRAWMVDSLTVPADERAALFLRAIGQTVPPDGAYGFHSDGVTLIAADYAEGRDYFRQIRASGFLVTADFDLVAASFLLRAGGQPFARLCDATAEETAFLSQEQQRTIQ